MRSRQSTFATTVLRLLAISLVLAAPSIAKATPAPLYYDPSNGNVAFDFTDTLGGIVGGYVLKSPTSALIPANHTPFLGSALITSLNFEVSQANGFGSTPGGVYSVGDVLPVGLSESDLLNAIDPGSSWIGGLGTPIRYFDIVYGPSPFPALNDPNAPPPVFDWAEAGTLTYYPTTGNLVMDLTGPLGGSIAGYEINANPALFIPSEFNPAGDLGYFDAFPTHIVEGEYGGIEADVYDLGAILPTGLDLAGLQSIITYAKFITAPGHSADDFDLDTNGVGFALQIAQTGSPVPEPSTYVMAVVALAGLGVVGYRRRHRVTK